MCSNLNDIPPIPNFDTELSDVKQYFERYKPDLIKNIGPVFKKQPYDFLGTSKWVVTLSYRNPDTSAQQAKSAYQKYFAKTARIYSIYSFTYHIDSIGDNEVDAIEIGLPKQRSSMKNLIKTAKSMFSCSQRGEKAQTRKIIDSRNKDIKHIKEKQTKSQFKSKNDSNNENSKEHPYIKFRRQSHVSLEQRIKNLPLRDFSVEFLDGTIVPLVLAPKYELLPKRILYQNKRVTKYLINQGRLNKRLFYVILECLEMTFDECKNHIRKALTPLREYSAVPLDYNLVKCGSIENKLLSDRSLFSECFDFYSLCDYKFEDLDFVYSDGKHCFEHQKEMFKAGLEMRLLVEIRDLNFQDLDTIMKKFCETNGKSEEWLKRAMNFSARKYFDRK